MKRIAICVPNPWDYIPLYEHEYSIMLLNPDATAARNQYLLEHADWSRLITAQGEQSRSGGDYPNEKIFWYTSGTTGDSKFCSFTADQVRHVCNQLVKDYDLTANDRYVSIMPLWHAHGQMFYWVSRMVGFETVFLPITQLPSLYTYRPTFITAIPDILRAVSRQDLSDLRFIRSASSALPAQLYQHLQEQFGVPVLESFGMTETCSHCFTNPLHGEQRIGTVGLPSGIEARIENEHLFVRGFSVAYTDWFDTGDLAEQDSAGYYRILGRATDRINVRGYKLDPVSLERQVRQQLPELRELVIFGTNTVKCVYSGSHTTQDVHTALTGLGQHCRPALIKHVVEVPKNASGKISRSMLDNMYQ